MANNVKRLLVALDRRTLSGQLDETSLYLLAQSAGIADLGDAIIAMKIVEAKGYATVKHSTVPEQNYLQITTAGIEEAMRLQMWFWRRWMADPALLREVRGGIIGAIIGIGGKEVLRLFWP